MNPQDFASALELLLKAHYYTQDLACSPWDFAVELACLHEAGLTNSDIRWLLSKKYILQGVETIPPPDGERRAFTALPSLVLCPKSCFIITTEGLCFSSNKESPSSPAKGPDAVGINGINGFHSVSSLKIEPSNDLPRWEKDRRTLFFKDQVVKQYKVPAPNQELILAVFQEVNWTYRIDDPLPATPLIDSKQRLHDAIGSLNRNQRQTLLRFHGDGSGEGICWEPCSTHLGSHQTASRLPTDCH